MCQCCVVQLCSILWYVLQYGTTTVRRPLARRRMTAVTNASGGWSPHLTQRARGTVPINCIVCTLRGSLETVDWGYDTYCTPTFVMRALS